MARIVIPTNPDELIALAKNITDNGAASPLAGLEMADTRIRKG